MRAIVFLYYKGKRREAQENGRRKRAENIILVNKHRKTPPYELAWYTAHAALKVNFTCPAGHRTSHPKDVISA